MFWWVFVPLVVVLAFLAIILWSLWQRYRRETELCIAQRDFHRRREWLEAHFLTLASQSGKPRGLRWANCDFDDEVSFARDRHSGRLRALVGVTIQFEAVAGGGMEDVPAVDNEKAATVVFRLDGPTWEPDGRALFNLNPAETIAHFKHELETVDERS